MVWITAPTFAGIRKFFFQIRISFCKCGSLDDIVKMHGKLKQWHYFEQPSSKIWIYTVFNKIRHSNMQQINLTDRWPLQRAVNWFFYCRGRNLSSERTEMLLFLNTACYFSTMSITLATVFSAQEEAVEKIS